jgi:hypothetical protein
MKAFLRCLLLPVDTKIWLLPYSAVAEVVEITIKPHLENIEWRGVELPLLHIKTPENSENKKNIAILNRCSEKGKEFLGLVLSGVPSMQRFKRSDIEWVANANEPYTLMEVKIRNQTAFIPNLEIL